MERLKEFVAFVRERQTIHERRAAGMPPPWTADPLLTRYRFCNVRREDDRVTRWIQENWLRPHERDLPACIFAMAVARLVNWPPSLERIGWPVPWSAARFVKAVDGIRAAGGKAYSSAYMIRAVEAAQGGGTKATYLTSYVLTPLWKARERLAQARSLEELHRALLTFYGMGSFIAAQIVADVKWTPALRPAPDWATFAAPGPGSMRGLNRVRGRELKAPWDPEEWHVELLRLRKAVLPKLPRGLRDLDAQNLQNCLCEFDKYMRAKNGEGRPRQNFKPSAEPYV